MKKITRRMMALVASAVLATGMVTFAAYAIEPYTKFKGDVNRDGKLSQKDAVLAARQTAGWDVGDLDYTAGDIDRDGYFDETDSESIAKYVSGMYEFIFGNTFTNVDVTESFKLGGFSVENNIIYADIKGGAVGPRTYSWTISGEKTQHIGSASGSLLTRYFAPNALFTLQVNDSEDNIIKSGVMQYHNGYVQSAPPKEHLSNSYYSEAFKASLEYSDGQLICKPSAGVGPYSYKWFKDTVKISETGNAISSPVPGSTYYCIASDSVFPDYYDGSSFTTKEFCVRDEHESVEHKDDMRYKISLSRIPNCDPVQGQENLAEAFGIDAEQASLMFNGLTSRYSDIKYYLTLSEVSALAKILDTSLFNIRITDMTTSELVLRVHEEPNGNANGNKSVYPSTSVTGGSGNYVYQWYYGDIPANQIRNYHLKTEAEAYYVENAVSYGSGQDFTYVPVDPDNRFFGKYFYCVITDTSTGKTVTTKATRIRYDDDIYDLYQWEDCNTQYYTSKDSYIKINFYFNGTCDIFNYVDSNVNPNDLTITCKARNNKNEGPAETHEYAERTNEYYDLTWYNLFHYNYTDPALYRWCVPYEVKRSWFNSDYTYTCTIKNRKTGLTTIIKATYDELVKNELTD